MSVDSIASAEVQIAGLKDRWFPHDVERVLVSSVLSGKRVKHTPEHIDIEPWSPWVKQMLQETSLKGKEQWRSCFVDQRERVLNFPKLNFTSLTRVDYPHGFASKPIFGSAVSVNWDHPSGELERFIPVGSFHTHPHDEAMPGSLSASDKDLQAFLGDDRQLFMGIACNNRIIFFLKTASTPQILPHDSLVKRIDTISVECATPGFEYPVSHADRMQFNKQVAIEFGLSVYTSDEEGVMSLRKLSLID